VPEVFGKYQMLTRIASGGMAEVWLARSSSIGGFEKLLAIKRMHSTLSKNLSFVSMFIDEAKLTVSLSHPNIVQIFDFGRVDDDYFMAMEYVEGFDLATLAKRARKQAIPIPVDMCVYIMRAVFDGLAYAHTRGDRLGRSMGIIHRDVSPQNVLVSFDGHVKVSDFGIARAASKIEQSKKSEIFGKLAYLSPEQSRGEPVTSQTDIWSAGVILYELVTNQRLFMRETDQMTLEAVNREPIKKPSAVNGAVPDDIDRVLLWVLERDPSARAESAREVAEALAEILRTHFPGATEYRLRDVISAMWDHHLPRVLTPTEDVEYTKGERPLTSMPEKTLPVGERTAAEIAAVARRSRGISQTSAWSKTPSPDLPRVFVHPRAESETQQGLGQALIADLTITGAPQTADETLEDPSLQSATIFAKEIDRLKRRFVQDPNLWTLVDIGQVYVKAGVKNAALGAFKLAAAKFAQRGLLVQAACIYRIIFSLADMTERLRDEVKRLRSLQGIADEELLAEVMNPIDDAADYQEYKGIFGTPQTLPQKPARLDSPEIFAESPIFSSLNAEQLVGIVQALELHRFESSDTIIKEGENGDSFYMIGRGRVVVSATNFAGQKIYVTSLADGDCFGEQSFFTGEPRNATVEAIEDVLVLEVSKEVLNRVIQEFPTVRESLRRFYKERIAESLLAKSPLFGQLSISARKMFAERFTFESYEPGDLIIKEGDQSDAFYAIKSGHVLVYTGTEENPIKLAQLSAGEIFGEIAAIEGTDRTANVRALSDCEILRLESSELNAMLAKNVDIRRLIEEKIEARAEERLRKIIEST
jgi:serine/threonine protein kinase/CRP-like cAMP-binding protein